MNVFALLLILFITIIIKNVAAILKLWRMIKFSRTLSGPDMKELMANVKQGQILKWLKELRGRYGAVFRIWFGKDLTVFFSDPDDIKTILSNNSLIYKSNNYNLIKPWLGNGLLTNGGEGWHKRRKMLTPAFHFKILSEFKQPMEDNCDILIGKLNQFADGVTEFDIYPFITLFALDVICETAMGIKKNAQVYSESEYVAAVQAICRISHKQSFTFWQRFEFLFNLSSHGKKRNAALNILHGETLKTIAIRRKMLEDENIHSMLDADKEDDIGIKRRLPFLDILLISQMEGANLSDTDVREEVDTFMFEGHDTTSSAIAFAIYLLSTHPEVQKNVLQEAVEFAGREKEPMKYLEAVIKETLRLYPSVPFYSRMLTEDFNIRGMTVPAGSSISILAYMIHRDPIQFPNPEAFKPERFLNSDKELHPFSFVAFSAGPRNCIGQRFAMLELKCTLSKFVRHFEILPAVLNSYQPNPLAELVMKSANGIKIKLKKR